MKKAIRFFVVILAILLVPLAVQAQPGSQPHPDPYSGDLSNYEGKWIINGKTEEDTNWTLEISGDKYHLHNEYQEFKGDIIFTPGNKDIGRSDILWLDFDPKLGIEIVLENLAGGLIDFSGQGLVFVRPGNYVEFDEDEEWLDYSKEKMVGDWVMDKMWVSLPEYNYMMHLTNEDIMAGSITGDTRFILSFDDGIVYQVSEKLEIRVPITRYRKFGRYAVYFENRNPLSPYLYEFVASVVPEEWGGEYAGQMVIDAYPCPTDPVRVIIYFTFTQITSVDQVEGGN
ncbi:MAG: hypothetical protein GX924_03030 [Clostridiaceae bacterium]|nr:hypothetical protein [Clostridiaceae bacterium]